MSDLVMPIIFLFLGIVDFLIDYEVGGWACMIITHVYLVGCNIKKEIKKAKK